LDGCHQSLSRQFTYQAPVIILVLIIFETQNRTVTAGEKQR
jgi:hypothetical protein